jgi:hypothetical protein
MNAAQRRKTRPGPQENGIAPRTGAKCRATPAAPCNATAPRAGSAFPASAGARSAVPRRPDRTVAAGPGARPMFYLAHLFSTWPIRSVTMQPKSQPSYRGGAVCTVLILAVLAVWYCAIRTMLAEGIL